MTWFQRISLGIRTYKRQVMYRMLGSIQLLIKIILYLMTTCFNKMLITVYTEIVLVALWLTIVNISVYNYLYAF